MAAIDFSPEKWSKQVVYSARKQFAGFEITNSDYVTEVPPGDKIWTFTPGDITIGNYTKNTGFAESLQVPDATNDYLEINQTKGFRFYVDKIDQVESMIDPFGPYADQAAYNMADTIDQAIMAQYANVSSSNILYPAAATASNNIWTDLNALYRKLTDSKVPLFGRYIVVSPRVYEIMQASLQSKDTQLGDQATTSGYMGMYAGFQVYLSHNVVSTTEAGTSGGTGSNVVHKCLVGVKSGISLVYTIQPTDIELYRPEGKMGRALEGITRYGIKTWRSGAYNGIFNAWWAS